MPDQDPRSAPPSLSDAINMLMENPEIISTVASALGNMSQPKETNRVTEEPVSQKNDQNRVAETSADLSTLAETLTPLLSGLGAHHIHEGHQGGSESARREALLCALKPYVSENRREAIDYIIRISKVSSVLKTIQS